LKFITIVSRPSATSPAANMNCPASETDRARRLNQPLQLQVLGFPRGTTLSRHPD